MKNNKGVTLIILIITVILLSIMAGLIIKEGTDSYKRSKIVKFETYMKILQKKVDIAVESNKILGLELTDEQKIRLQEIIDYDTKNEYNYIETTDVNEQRLRYFSPSDIEELLELEDVNDEIVVNFTNREIISLNGIEKNEVMHYVVNGL